MDARKIGAFISEKRKNKSYTQAELAQLLNVSHQAVSKWERGESLPDIGLLPLTAKLLGVTIDDLLKGEVTLAPPAPNDSLETQITQLPNQTEHHAVHTGQHTVLEAQHRMTFDHVSSLAPFLSHEALDRLVNHAEEESMELDVVAGLGPFLSKATLSRLVHRAADGSMAPNNIMGLAPFLEQSDLTMLIESRGINGLQPEHLAGLAPFLPQVLIEKLALGFKPEHASDFM